MNVVIKIILTILIILLFMLTIVVAYFFLYDIETKEPSNIEEDCIIETNEFMGRKVFTISPNKDSQEKKYILYFHGGSYVAEATENHWEFLEKIVRDTGYNIIMPDYPLTPKYNYKDVFNMMTPLYKEILDNINPSDLILMGDSAGGGLALGLYEEMSNKFVELPSKTILISPWLDVRMENKDIAKVQKNDDILNKESLKIAGIAYAGEEGMDKYLVNPILGDLSKLKNVIVYTGTYDILYPDIKLLEEKTNLQGGKVEIKEYEGAKHIWLIDNNSNADITRNAYNSLIEDLKMRSE